jgi:predicted O-methyltransferase YrrM
MHGRENVQRLYETMDIIRRFARGEELLFADFDNYIRETNLIEKPINIWRDKIKNCKFDCWDCNYCDKIYEKKSDIKHSELVQHTVAAIAKSGIPTVRIDVKGLTSPRVQTLLNTLARGVSTYMEIGAAMGATFCAVLKDNPLRAVAIDSWQQNIQPANRATLLPTNRVETFIENVKKYKGDSTVDVINGDLFKVDVEPFTNSIQMLFYDGPHDLESTRKAVEHYYSVLTNEAIIVFDDANWEGVVAGAREGLNAVGAHVVYEKLILNSEENANEWWNGLYVMVIRK